jgi:GTP pyrophosphokinase
MVSKYGHAKQMRENGTRYFDHPKSVAWTGIDEFKCLDPEVVIINLLHDLKEDTYLMSLYRLGHNFGEVIALDLRAITKLPKGKETTLEYLMRIIARGARVIFAKLCDRLHNLRELGDCTPEKIARQIAETREYHLPILVPALRNFGGQWAVYADLMEQKILEATAQYE